MLSLKIRISFFLIILFNIIKGQVVYSAANEINFEQYSVEHGLVGPETFKIYQDKEGFLWIPTTSGVSRFDGLNFQNFSAKNGLPINSVGSVIQDKNGAMWLGTMRGLVVYKNRRFLQFDSTKKMPTVLSWSMFEDKDSTLWIGTGFGVYHVDPDKLNDPLIKHYKFSDKVSGLNDVRTIVRNNENKLLVGTDHGIYELVKDSFQIYANYFGMGYSIVSVNDSTEWACGWGSDIMQIINGKYRGNISLGTAVMGITKTKSNEIWLATWDKGIFKYDGTDFINYDHEQGLNYSSFWGCFTDAEDNVWFSSWGKGIFKYSGERFSKITDKSGLVNNNVIGIHKAPDGKIWFSTEGGLTYLDPKSNYKKSFTQLEGVKLSKIICSIVKPDNEVIAFGYAGYGYRIKNEKITQDASLYGFSALIDRNGDLVVGYEGRGAIRYRKDGVDSFYLKKANRANSVERLFQDNKGNFWMSTDLYGFNYYNGKKTINLSSKRGFRNGLGYCVCDDIKGNYWIGTKGKGIYHVVFINDTTVKIKDSLTQLDGIISDNINSLHINKGKLFIGTDRGLNIMDLKMYEYNKEKLIRSYTKGDGFVNSETSVAYFEESGPAWIRTDKGAFLYNPKYDQKNSYETKNHILSVKLFQKSTNWLDHSDSISSEGLPVNLDLSYNNNHISFSYIGICLSSPLKVRYQYKLEGLEKNWSPVTESREAIYSSIPPGTYTFMVKSCNNDDLWNSTPTTFTFTITPPFWKTTWFNILIIFIIISVLIIYVKRREKKLKEEKLILEGKVAERTGELKEALVQVEEKQKEIIDSINYAKRIQAAYLPTPEIFHYAFKDAFLLFKPKDIVSGDFYWFYALNGKPEKGTFFCAVADCTGHGVPGALMSVICCNALNDAAVTQGLSDTDQILNETRRLVKQNLKSTSYSGQKDGMDISLIKMNVNTGELWYSGAYNPIWIVSNEQLIELNADKQPIGVYERENDFKTQFVQMKKGDVVYLFSDGFADQFGGLKGKKFKYKNMADLMVENYKKPMSQQKNDLETSFENWKGQLEHVDDVCVIGIRF